MWIRFVCSIIIGVLTLIRLCLLLVLCAHSSLTFYSWVEFGYTGFFPPFQDSNTTQIFSDLLIALSLVNGWIYMDLQSRKLAKWWIVPVLLGTILAGSFAPLLYFLIHPPTLKLNSPSES